MSRSQRSTSSPAYTWYFLAMAHHKLGNDEEAKTWLDKANEWTDEVFREHEEGTASLAWNRKLTLELLRNEAEALIRTNAESEEVKPIEESAPEVETPINDP